MKPTDNVSYRLLFESAPGLYLILLPDLTIVAVSNAYLEATMTRRDEILNRHLFDVFPDNPDDPNATGVSNLRASLMMVLETRKPHTMAVQKYDIRRPDGSFEERYWSPLNKPVLDATNKVLYIIHRVENVTEFVRMKAHQEEQQQITHELRRKLMDFEIELYTRAQEIQSINKNLQQQVMEKTAEIKNIFERITDSFLALDNNGCFNYMNNRAAAALRLTEEQVLGKTLEEVYAPKIWGNKIREAYEHAVSRQEHHCIEVFSNNSLHWFEIDFYPSSSGVSLFFRDITERKRTEEQLRQSHDQLRQLASHLQNIREEEQKRIAREVHDELGQQITGLKMDVSWVKKRISQQEKPAVLDQRLSQMLTLLDSAVLSVRKISSELRPAILDDFGLVTALEWQSEEFERRFSIPVTFHSTVKQIEVPSALATGLFRTYQESLTNVARHANAKQVISSLELLNGDIRLIIADNGKGFDTRHNGQKKTLGLLGMKERVLMMDGDLEIKSEPGRGTTITITVPLNDKRQ
jgi:PAS domain S-box-containing protein